MWKRGSASSSRSRSVHRHASRRLSALANRFAWESTAPFGAPVVPDVYPIKAGASRGLASRAGVSPSGRSRRGSRDVERRVEITDRGLLVGLVDDRRARAGIPDHVLELSGPVGRVRGDHDEPHAQGRRVGRHEVDGALGREQDAIAARQAEGGEAAGPAGRLRFEFPAREPAALRVVDLVAIRIGNPMARPGGGHVRGAAGGRVVGGVVGAVGVAEGRHRGEG